MSTTPTKIAEPGGGAAAIGKSVIVKGQIYSREDLYVDGEIEGTVEVQEHRLTVGPNGKVKATIKARDVIVRGTVHGNIEAGDKVDIRKEAKVVGDLRTTRIVVEDGAYFKGAVDIVRQEVTRKPPESKPAPQPKPEAPRQQTLAEAARPASQK
jgi:cytoskeletal protein CcmA (bactofilin family)